MSWFRKTSEKSVVTPSIDSPQSSSDSQLSVVYDGDLAFTRVKGGNDSGVAYQEAVGAPVENASPLGYNVGWATIIFLNVNQMVGTGIFSTRMLQSTHISI